jgi:hypothetical protein
MLSGTFPITIAHQLRQIWQQMAEEIAGDAIVVSEEHCPSISLDSSPFLHW